ncbi:unnamed protein product [Closterium sp. NIES-54]
MMPLPHPFLPPARYPSFLPLPHPPTSRHPLAWRAVLVAGAWRQEEEEEARREAAEVEWLRGEVRVARRWMDVQRLVWINRDRQHRSLLRRGGHEEQRAQLQHMM